MFNQRLNQQRRVEVVQRNKVLFLLSSPVQSHGGSVRSPILHVHHTGFLYVLDGLGHLLLFLLQVQTQQSHHPAADVLQTSTHQ